MSQADSISKAPPPQELVELVVPKGRSIVRAKEGGLKMGRRMVDGHLVEYVIRSEKETLPPGTRFRVPASEAKELLERGHALLPEDYVAAPAPARAPAVGLTSVR